MISAWERIVLEDLPCRYGSAEIVPLNGPWLRASLAANHDGFRLELTAVLPAADRHATYAALPQPEAFEIALVNGPHRIVVETDEAAFTGSTGDGRVSQHHESWDLPWPQDPLADTWLSLRIDDRRFAIELPYGVCRDEAHPMVAPTTSTARPPGEVHRWSRVDYQASSIGPWSASIHATAGRPGDLQIQLYRAPFDQAEIPDVTFSLASVSGTGRERHPNPAEPWTRIDPMRIARHYICEGLEVGRHYVLVTTRIGESSASVVIPSSLFAP